ncbi:MAG: hypothetical protein HOP21_10930 [Methylotenera sp.]|nr:hypothetical protein [Methylotenera sp.]
MLSQSEGIAKAKTIAQRIVNDEIGTYEGAMQIWKQILDKLEGRIPDALWSFKSNASAIEDCLWNAVDSGSNHDDLIARCKDEIKWAAKSLLFNKDVHDV